MHDEEPIEDINEANECPTRLLCGFNNGDRTLDIVQLDCNNEYKMISLSPSMVGKLVKYLEQDVIKMFFDIKI